MKNFLVVALVLLATHAVVGNTLPRPTGGVGGGRGFGGRGVGLGNRGGGGPGSGSGGNLLRRLTDTNRQNFNWTTTFFDTTVTERASLSDQMQELRIISRDRALRDNGYNKASILMDFDTNKMAIYVQLPKLDDDTVVSWDRVSQGVSGWMNRIGNSGTTDSTSSATSGTEMLLEKLRQWFATLQMSSAGRSKRAADGNGSSSGGRRRRRRSRSACFITDSDMDFSTASRELSLRTSAPLSLGNPRSLTAEATNAYTEETLKGVSPKIADFCRRATRIGNTYELVQSSASAVTTGDEVFKVIGLIDDAESNRSIPLEIRVDSAIDLRH